MYRVSEQGTMDKSAPANQEQEPPKVQIQLWAKSCNNLQVQKLNTSKEKYVKKFEYNSIKYTRFGTKALKWIVIKPASHVDQFVPELYTASF